MRGIVNLILFLLILFSFVFPDKSYSIEDVTIRSVIHMDGTVDIEESRSYQFNGKFSWVEYVLPKKGFIEIHAITITTKYNK
mgnify:CR=1 FL=1